MPAGAAPHARRTGRATEVTLRVLFAAEPDDEARVRRLIDEALARGEGDGPDGERTAWRLLCAGPSPSGPRRSDHARRLTRS